MFRILFYFVTVLAVGCGVQGTSTIPGPKPTASTKVPVAVAEGQQFLLSAEPANARGTIDVRKQAKNGDDVAVVGRVGGDTEPFTQNRVSFLMVDPSLPPATECECPWDYCNAKKDDLAAAKVFVKFVDADGKTLAGSARDWFGIKELSTVVVQGKVQRDDKDNVLIVGSKIFVRPDK